MVQIHKGDDPTHQMMAYYNLQLDTKHRGSLAWQWPAGNASQGTAMVDKNVIFSCKLP